MMKLTKGQLRGERGGTMNGRIKLFPVFMILVMIILGLFCFATGATAEKLIIPSGVTVIEAEAFYGDTSLEEVVLPEGISRIEIKAFSNTSLTPTGKLLLKDDQTDTIIANITNMVKYCKTMSLTTYGFYQVWKTGDPLAFAAAVGS